MSAPISKVYYKPQNSEEIETMKGYRKSAAKCYLATALFFAFASTLLGGLFGATCHNFDTQCAIQGLEIGAMVGSGSFLIAAGMGAKGLYKARRFEQGKMLDEEVQKVFNSRMYRLYTGELAWKSRLSGD